MTNLLDNCGHTHSETFTFSVKTRKQQRQQQGDIRMAINNDDNDDDIVVVSDTSVCMWIRV